MINLRDITETNLISIIDLDVGEDQKDQVAPNSVSIAEGNYSKSAWFKGIFNDDQASRHDCHHVIPDLCRAVVHGGKQGPIQRAIQADGDGIGEYGSHGAGEHQGDLGRGK